MKKNNMKADTLIMLGAPIFLTKTEIAPKHVALFPIGTIMAGRLASWCRVGEKIRLEELNRQSVTITITEIIPLENDYYTIKTKTATYTLQVLKDEDVGDEFNQRVQKTKELHGMI